MTYPRHVLYRHYDANENLLYIGISVRPLVRLESHRGGSKWFRDIAKITIEEVPSGQSADQMEQAAINREKPKYNRPRRKKNAPLDMKVDEIVEADWKHDGHPGALTGIEPPLDLED